MQFSTSLYAIATLCAASAVAQTPVTSPATFATGPLIDALTKANLTVLAGLAATHAQALLPYLTTAGNKTLLTPTDEAVNKVKSQFTGMSASQVEAILLYHVINGTISYKTLPSAFDYNLVVPTFLNDTTFTHLPAGKKQKLVLQRKDSDDPIDIVYGSNDTAFSSRLDGPTAGSLQIQVIDEVLFPPGPFSTLASDDASDLMAMHMALQNSTLISNVEAAKGITIFAPITSAFQKVQDQVVKTTDREKMMILLNHIVNGTSVYSPQFPSNEAQNGPVKTKITTLRTAAGMELNLKYVKDGSVHVSSDNFTAKIVKSDVLVSNGVVHYIDAVLLNTSYNMTSASNTSDQTVGALPSVEAQSMQGVGSTHGSTSSSTTDGAMSAVGVNMLIVMPIAIVLAAVFTLA